MRQPFVLFSGSEPSRHTRSLAGFITTTSGFKFSVHTAGDMTGEPFLPGKAARSLSVPDGLGFAASELYIGPGNQGLEIVVGRVTTQPTAGALQAVWRARRAGRATPVVAVARYRSAGNEKIALCGATGERPPVHFDVDAGQS